MLYIIAGFLMGSITSLIYCKVHNIQFRRNCYGISEGNTYTFIGGIIGSLIGSFYRELKN